ncbi:DUF4365 domain-containing protein [Streptomyces sp. NPDC007896]|uniref:DUF4365 domain-containing protein n=1 Tax=Streptomyces sp. NPDC007896 TaxID=3364784 RepID=UPI0036EC48E7
MTRRPRQHQVASYAVAAVRQEWNRRGHAVDEIKEDYGEDLLVQTCLDGHMDPGKIWIQVKGTEKGCRDSGRNLPSVYVDSNQILRWARSADLVIAVLWDVKDDCGWYTEPKIHFNHLKLKEQIGHQLPLNFSRDQPFDQDAVDHLAWSARIEHVNQRLQYALASALEAEKWGEESGVIFHTEVAATLALDFAIATKVTDSNGVASDQFLTAFYAALGARKIEDRGVAKARAAILAASQVIRENCANSNTPLRLAREMATLFLEGQFGRVPPEAL